MITSSVGIQNVRHIVKLYRDLSIGSESLLLVTVVTQNLLIPLHPDTIRYIPDL